MTIPKTACCVLFLSALMPAPVAAAPKSILSAMYGRQSDDSLQLFKEVMERIRNEYVDEVTEKKLLDAALDGMLRSLDPHSGFLDAKAMADFSVGIQGEFSGIGVELILDKGKVRVVTPYIGAPAFRAGVKVGDVICAVDHRVLQKETLAEVAEMLRGAKGSKVVLTLEREKSGKIELEIERDTVRLAPVNSILIPGGIAYLNISVFNARTDVEVMEQYRKLSIKSATPLRGVILDMRWNPGGLFEQAVRIAELFMDEGEIVSVRGRRVEDNEHFHAEGEDITGGLPLVILVNGGTASAPEIVTGALQDNQRAVVIGTNTFGKASVQSIMLLGHGEAIKLTTARYYTPKGKLIEGSGITPDILVAPENNIPHAGAGRRDRQLDKAVSYIRNKLQTLPPKP